MERFSSKKNGALVRLEQPDDVFEQNALALTAEAYNGRDLLLIDLQVDAIENGSGSEPLGDVLEFDQRNIHGPPITIHTLLQELRMVS